MGIKLYGSPLSTCNQRVAMVLLEKEVPYEQIALDFTKGEHKKPEFLKLQPFGRVPALDDDGFLIFESRAIAKYLAKKYAGQGTKLLPEDGDLKGFALFEQAASVEQNYFDGPVSGIGFEKIFKSMKGLGATDETALANHAANLDSVLAVYDGILAKQAYLAGDELTLADLFHIPYGTLARCLGYQETFDKYPNVKRWWDGLVERESWKKLSS